MSKSRIQNPESRNWLVNHPYQIISLVCILLYGQILSFGLVQFDDHGFVLMARDNLRISNIPEFFRHSVFWVLGDTTQETDVFYRPLQNVIYAICNTIASGRAWIYHFFGLGFHVLASCLLFRFFQQFKVGSSVSLLFALIYSVHPVLVQGVAWIAGIGDQMATVFVLLTLNSGIKERKIFPQLVFFFCALFSKEISIMVIPVYLFLFFVIEKKRADKNFFVTLLGWMVITVVYFVMRSGSIHPSNVSLIFSATQSLKTNGLLVLEYFEKIFLPYRLSPIPSREDAHYLTGGIILFAFMTVFIFRKRFTRRTLFGALWFVLFLFPSFVQQNPQAHFFAFEHRLYLPFIGILIMLIELLNLKEINFNVPMQKYGFMCMLILFAGVTFSHSRTFKDPYTFYNKALSASPKSVIAYNGYGQFLLRDEKYAEAIEAFKNSYRYKPDDFQTTGKIAEIYMKNLNNPQEAIAWFRKTLEIAPHSIEAAVSIGDVYWHLLHDTSNAITWYRNALNVQADNEFALANLGMIYGTAGKNEEAKKYLIQSLNSNPVNLVALKWIAIVLFNEGKISESLKYLNQAYANYRNDPEVIRNLMICHYKLNDFENTKRFSLLLPANQIPSEIVNYLNRH